MADSHKLFLSRYAYQGALIDKTPNPDLGMVIVLPCYDEPGILQTLESLFQCSKPDCRVEAIIVVNHPANSTEEVKNRNRVAMDELINWSKAHSNEYLSFYPVWQGDLPKKHAGVGLARKIGMDEAVWRFHKAGKRNGLIVNFDADCTCREDYLVALDGLMNSQPNLSGCSIYFEHPIDDLEEPLRTFIIDYELHLRYHVLSLSHVDYPYPYHTVGSSMAVSLRAYTSQGGMNKRKAGEDFYFLHKIFPLGNYFHLNNTVVYPGARYSMKVPFGTGAALTKMRNNENAPFRTYNWQSYLGLGKFLEMSEAFFHRTMQDIQVDINNLPKCIGNYLSDIGFLAHIESVKKGATTQSAFRKAFFRWFDGLKMLQYLNFASRHCFPDQELNEAASMLTGALSGKRFPDATNEQLLLYLRDWERSAHPD